MKSEAEVKDKGLSSPWEETDFDDCPFDVDERELEKYEEEMFRHETLSDPRRIYEFLKTKVYHQDEAAKAVAICLYNHVHGIPNSAVFVGPPGSGKTLLWQTVRDYLYDAVYICDASSMTKSGFSGQNKIYTPLREIDIQKHDRTPFIIVFDEADKMMTPSFTRDRENVSASVQSELLTLLQPSFKYYMYKTETDTRYVNIETLSWIFTGSFAVAAKNEANKASSIGLGFGAERKQVKAFENELTIQNLIDFGMIPEVASRIGRIVNIKPLSIEDYKHLLLSHEASPVRNIEKKYKLENGFINQHILSASELTNIAENAYKSGLGVRATTAAIQCQLDNYLFEHFDEL